MSNKRTSNFTETDRSLLIKIANSYKLIIEYKKTDATTWKEKEEAWKRVEIGFNSSASGPPRTAKQLKTKYEAIKKELKKRFHQHHKYVTGTGGGTYICPPTPKTEEEKILAETISFSIQGLQNNFDSDGVAGISGLSYEDTQVEESQTEDVLDDWTPPNNKMLKTHINPILKPHENSVNEEKNVRKTECDISTKTMADEENVDFNYVSDHSYGKTPNINQEEIHEHEFFSD
ncbi:fibrinogen silencer-binding protein-like [Leptinotarsa decemlineata]|uniref:fibrinogen silencer-binding protein-like n=1 Tax=Leptinotarsa decemlineata TaxID=7539 RepID=UPI003D305994